MSAVEDTIQNTRKKTVELTPYYHAARARSNKQNLGQTALETKSPKKTGEISQREQALATVIEILKTKSKITSIELAKINRATAKKFGVPPMSKAEILKAARLAQFPLTPELMKLLRTASVRGLSGVTVITVLTKPYHCPGKCVYCPLEPGMPKSYISSEPGAQRAVANQFDPYRQVNQRLQALWLNGHEPDKVELIILGGTWSAYPKRYQTWFVKKCFEACNHFHLKATQKKSYRSLEATQVANETAAVKIIGVTLETRPDYIDREEIRRLRQLGCTRVQIGAQSLDDGVLTLIERGHDVASITQATALLRSAGFKFDYHLMPNLPGSNPAMDEATYRLCFTDPRFIPDQVKIYPCIVNKFAPLYQWWKDGRWTQYSDEVLEQLLTRLELFTPSFVRLNRLVRDIPAEAINAGNTITNLRQIIEGKMKLSGKTPVDIRYREAKGDTQGTITAKLNKQEYLAAGAKEIFLSFDSPDLKTIYAFCRLRLPAKNECWLPELKDPKNLAYKSVALIRELHVYGQMTPVREDLNLKSAAQHVGLGKKLMAEAEKIALAGGYRKMAVIAGIGTRGYYRKLGYKRVGTYMVKKLIDYQLFSSPIKNITIKHQTD